MKKFQFKKLASVSALGVFVTILAFFTLMAFTPDNKGLAPGDKAVDFNLKNIDGKMVSLQSGAGTKGAIVVFTCNHCPFSKLYEDRIIGLQKTFGPQGYPVIAINPNDVKKEPEDSFDNMVQRAKDKGFNFAYLHDESQAIAKAYGAERTPHVFLLSRKGDKFSVEYVGAIDNNAEDAGKVTENYVEKAIKALDKGKNPEPASVKAIGCRIKWRS